jgi:preprotein translocase subunit YajC
MLFVEKIHSLCERFLSYVYASGEYCAQNLLSAIYYVKRHLKLPTVNATVAKFLAKFVWRPRGKSYPQIITFKKQTLDPHLWSIFAFKGAPIYLQIASRNSQKKDDLKHPNRQTKKLFIYAQIALAILVIWFTQISIAHAQNNARALPTAGQVVAGSAVITQSGLQTQVNQSTQRAVVNWESFNVGKDAPIVRLLL